MKKVTIGNQYLTRWHVIPRNRWFNIYLHKFTGSDNDRALHDHPWWSISFNFSGKLLELYEEDYEILESGVIYQYSRYRYIKKFLPVFRKATHMHRMILESKQAWTLFITGPARREWGFRVAPIRGGDEKGWMHHEEFVALHGE